MALESGSRIGPYEVEDLLGEGGMGQVYRARDTQLRRRVALKVVSDAIANDPDRLARFQREAEVLAALSHPGIAAIYGLAEADGVRALVLELVEGETLADRVARGPLSVEEAVPIAEQIAAALAAAHAPGIVHRDLKPANVKVATDGSVKVLDFGLAKATAAPSASGSTAYPSDAITQAETALGAVIGTAAYMSPEQARGEEVDGRTDIWALGCVLFEMLTRRRPFGGTSGSEMIASILRDDVAWEALPEATPSTLRRFLRRSLEKDPKDRIQHIGDARADLRDALADPELPAAELADSRPRRRPGTVAALAAVVLAIAAAGAWLMAGRTGDRRKAQVVSFDVEISPATPLRKEISISPDGRLVAGPGGVRSLRETQRTIDTAAWGFPVFSPDSRWALFLREGLQVAPVDGGPARTLAEVGQEARLLGMSWGGDQIVYATPTGLYRTTAAGGEPVLLRAPDPDEGELWWAWPEVLPSGSAALVTIVHEDVSDVRIAAVDLETSETTEILRRGTTPVFAASGHLLFVVDGFLHAVEFDPESLRVGGEPVRVLDDPLAMARLTGAQYDVADTGTLVYLSAASAGPPSELLWIDRDGREASIQAPPQTWNRPRLSPDGR
ncbi:MAG: serine/threonine-protein kinase, partial [Thermoanaerobaculia bacterium]|nr:serine/threonine-protein kinase [Thermoanaerobaculia bacterium]